MEYCQKCKKCVKGKKIMERRITDVKPEDFRKEYSNVAISNIIIDVQRELYVLRQMVEKIIGENKSEK